MLIIDTDLGGDPDDAIALAAASRLPELALVVTSDECGGRRARLTRHLLDLLGRSDVQVVAGIDLGNERYWAADGLIPDAVPEQPTDVAAAVDAALRAHPGEIRWLGIGPLSNLAAVLTSVPDARRLRITQMGGGLTYRHADRAEHNVRLDVEAARTVLHAGMPLRVLPSNISFVPDNEITTDATEYRLLAGADGPWALIRAHIDQWFAAFHPGTMQADALALALAMDQPFVRTARTGVDLDDIGRMVPGECQVDLAEQADYPRFRAWLTERLRLGIAESAVSP
ncbi:nucleoside hydrolase [Nocardia sp. NPDC050793]|uniref:nucleoside hydrolase n=1 Tax=Nocardia sp. NPDC050793 TaxID=3155159 RepID=UPI0033CA91AA